MKNLLTTIVFSVLYFLLATSVAAQYGQYGQYGGTSPSQTVLIEKMVSTAATANKDVFSATYVNNLSPADPRYAPGAQVQFKLRVKNTSSIVVANVTVKDYLPADVEPFMGPGAYDGNTRTITFNAGDFKPGEEKVYYLTMKVVAQDKLPADQGLVCLLNKATAYNGSVSDESSSQFCVEKQVMGVTSAPAAGPEAGLLLLTLQTLGVATGIYLKKKAI